MPGIVTRRHLGIMLRKDDIHLIQKRNEPQILALIESLQKKVFEPPNTRKVFHLIEGMNHFVDAFGILMILIHAVFSVPSVLTVFLFAFPS